MKKYKSYLPIFVTFLIAMCYMMIVIVVYSSSVISSVFIVIYSILLFGSGIWIGETIKYNK